LHEINGGKSLTKPGRCKAAFVTKRKISKFPFMQLLIVSRTLRRLLGVQEMHESIPESLSMVFNVQLFTFSN